MIKAYKFFQIDFFFGAGANIFHAMILQNMSGWFWFVLWLLTFSPSCFSILFSFTDIIFTILTYVRVYFIWIVKVFSLTRNSVHIFLVFHVINNLKLSPASCKNFWQGIWTFHFLHSMEFQAQLYVFLLQIHVFIKKWASKTPKP